MGLVSAEIELVSGEDLVLHRKGYISEGEIKKERVIALVDTGAYMLAINENIMINLGLSKVDTQMIELAYGSYQTKDVVGPIEIRFENRRANVDAIVLPGDSEVLLGAIPMEDLDVSVNPKEQKLIVNPESPYIAKKKMK
jgi:clan AA aspartic protease